MGKYVSFYKVAVEEDMSQWILEEWLKAGFRELEWEYAYEEWKDTKKWKDQGSVCPTCFALDGHRFKIQDVLDKTTHNAPKYSMSHVGCFSKDTEIYTEDGFKLVKDVKVGDKVLALNPKTLGLDWVKAIDTVSYKQDKMIHFHNKNLDLLVTPNHRMFHVTPYMRSLGRKEGKFIEADKLPKSALFYRSSEWKGKDNNALQFGLTMEEFCKFMGYFLAEGSLGRINQIMIAQFDKAKKKKMWNDLRVMNFKTVSNVKQGIYINAPELYNYLKQFGKCNEKYVPRMIKELPAKLIRIFLDAFRLGDGSTVKPKQKIGGYEAKVRRTYWTSSKRMADDLGELIIKVGKRPCYYLAKRKGKVQHFKNGDYTINHDVWTVGEGNGIYSGGCRSRVKREVVDYNDYVYCVELEKHNTLLVRKSGTVVWSGNCYCRMKRIPREDERLDYPKEQETKTMEQKLDDIGYTVVHIEEGIRDLFQRQGVKFEESDIQDVKQKVLEYAEGLSMSNKSTARDQIWRTIQREVWAITKQRKGNASYFGFIRIANQVKRELGRTLYGNE